MGPGVQSPAAPPRKCPCQRCPRVAGRDSACACTRLCVSRGVCACQECASGSVRRRTCPRALPHPLRTPPVLGSPRRVERCPGRFPSLPAWASSPDLLAPCWGDVCAPCSQALLRTPGGPPSWGPRGVAGEACSCQVSWTPCQAGGFRASCSALGSPLGWAPGQQGHSLSQKEFPCRERPLELPSALPGLHGPRSLHPLCALAGGCRAPAPGPAVSGVSGQ